MEGILKFNLSEPEERIAHLRAVKSLDMALALWDMDQYLRGQIKHGNLEKCTQEALSEAREQLRVVMTEHAIDLDELLN